MNDFILRAIAPFQNFNPEVSQTLSSTTNPARLSETDIPCRMVRIRALPGNTGNIFIGSSRLTSSNATISLTPGQVANIRIENVKNVFALPASANDQLNYIWVT